MYPSKGNNPYGQQPYGSSQAYGHIVSLIFILLLIDLVDQIEAFAKLFVVVAFEYSFVFLLRLSPFNVISLLQPGSGYTGNPVGGSDTDMNSYRTYSSQAPQYGGPYASVYGSSGLSNVQQVLSLSRLYDRLYL